MASQFRPAKEYPWLCQACQETLSNITALFEQGEMPDTDDEEAPSMYMYDHQLYCDGFTCNR